MPKFIIFIVSFLLLVGGAYYYFLYPPSLYRHEAQKLLDALSAAVETQNAAEVKRVLNAVLMDDAKIELEVRLPSASAQQTGAVKEPFSKPDFLSFIDNTLYSLSAYHFKGKADSLTLTPDRSVATFLFSGTSDARANSGEFGVPAMLVNGQSQCVAELKFVKDVPPVMQHLSCVVTLQYGLSH